ncbi:3-isopropylmalate dehydratase large subunit [Anaerobacillus sp. CMMVII]|uniref:3-isopropylmalate dehydratase large subunit n=1 Tax=Anaerobacillus sp. CMMVII TaxID=2755588 RepID=UPI0021B790E3|nr:3-isopropylmalate dehydratase large subunit [Anaerobacillus sp. CMMVII]MCT8140507.1 3-isopropylmalate dehydratase large subunit [Anaerobacillus sp. CMMVII]
MGKTMLEKILSFKSGTQVSSGELTIVDVDMLVSHDGNRPQATDVFYEMGGERVFDKDKVKLVIDHAPTVPNQTAAAIHAQMRQFADQQQVEIIGPGEGICHQVIAERGYVYPGNLLMGTDSHTCTYGALNMLGIGVGTSDLAAVMLTGKIWLKVPETIKVELTGEIPDGVYPKDIVLELIRVIRADGATYKALEFCGDALNSISIEGRMTISNMAVEAGAKTAIFPYDDILKSWLEKRQNIADHQPVYPDPDASYEHVITINVSELKSRIAIPDQVENVVSSEALGIKINQAIIGTCVNGRLEDLEVAAHILKEKKLADDVRLFITPASREIYLQALEKGYIETFVKAGANIGIPGCSGCTGGAHFAIPSDGDVVITSANRNFVGRLGNPKASIYLASPAVVALSAINGKITFPTNKGGVAI